VPPIDAAREAALLRAFERRHSPFRSRHRRGARWLWALAGTTALLVAVVPPDKPSRPTRAAGGPSSADRPATAAGRPFAVGDFIPWPGAAGLPPLESGELVRMDLPVAMLPSLGVAPPSGHVTAVSADIVIGQDGFARAVRFVAN
jgi:hypothetical protein